MRQTKQHPIYQPPGFIYGFLGKESVLPGSIYVRGDFDANKKRVLAAVGEEDRGVCLVSQIHSNKCYLVEDKEFSLVCLEGDAMVTNRREVLLVIETADCVPILFFDRNKSNVGAVHAGWRGALGGVIESAIAQLVALGSNVSDIEVVIGPCIMQKNYEVGPEFYEEFIALSQNNSVFFKKIGDSGKFLFDLPDFVVSVLKQEGIEKIFDVGIDTYSNQEWFSYREDTHKNDKKRSGSNLSFIGIK